MHTQRLLASVLIVSAMALTPNVRAAPVAAAVAASDINVCVPRTSGNVPNQSVPLPQQSGVLTDCSNRLATPYKYSTNQQPVIRNTNVVYIYVGDGSNVLGHFGVTGIHTTIGTKTADTCDVSQVPLASSYYVPCWINSDYFPDAAQGDLITFSVDETDNTASPPQTATYGRYAVFTKRLTVAGKALGFWLPVGLFGTDLKSTTDGIGLAVLPVGVAWGLQYHLSGTDYLGVSAFGSWSIIPGKPTMTSAMATTNATTGYTVQSLTAGGFIDGDGYVYLGAAYAWDLRQGYSNPGLLMVLGAGPRLLDVLKAQPK
jgi:hypothetical protein